MVLETDSLLAKRIIWEFNSAYYAPVGPVLKPPGKLCLTIDYSQLNKLVPLSCWPMAQLDQELPKVENAKYFSTIDMANGFWAMTVDPQVVFVFLEQALYIQSLPVQVYELPLRVQHIPAQGNARRNLQGDDNLGGRRTHEK